MRMDGPDLRHIQWQSAQRLGGIDEQQAVARIQRPPNRHQVDQPAIGPVVVEGDI